MSKLQLYLSQTTQRRMVFIWLEQCCNPWLAPAGDTTNWPHHPAIKNMTFNPVSIDQLTCLHYHPGQQWDGAEQPTASSHLQLQHNQREHCSDAWQAAWPSPGTDNLQHKVLSSSVQLSSLQHHLLLTGILCCQRNTKCRPPSIIHWFTETGCLLLLRGKDRGNKTLRRKTRCMLSIQAARILRTVKPWKLPLNWVAPN